MTKKLIALTLSMGIICALFSHSSALQTPSAHAQTLAFNANNIISDSAFTSQIYDANGIQAFLQQKGSWLASYTLPEYQNVFYQFKDASGNCQSNTISVRQFYDTGGDALFGMSAASLIASQATKYGVNAQVLLAELQKESTAITRSTQKSDINTAWVLGVGWNDTMAACGYDEATAHQRALDWGGIGQQIAYAYKFALIKFYNSYATTYNTAFTTLDGTVIRAENRATRSLYAYTPYVAGARSFWTIFNDYFPSYSHVFVGQTANPTLAPGAANQFTVTVRNSGTATWTSDVVHLATNRTQDHIPVFTRESNDGSASGWLSANRIALQETTVAPGELGHFVFWLRNDGVAPGVYREYFRVVADGITWMEDLGIYFDVTATPLADAYHYKFIGQNASPSSALVNFATADAIQFQLEVENTGSKAWAREQVNLATDRAADRVPGFTRESNNGSPSGWLKANRVVMQETSVAPGEHAHFVFWMRNDGNVAGTYKEYFRLVAENITWMEDYGIYWQMTVLTPDQLYQHQWVSQSDHPAHAIGTLALGQAYQFTLKVKNTGLTTWRKGIVNLGTSHPRDRIPVFTRESHNASPSGWVKNNRITMQEDAVAPGVTATFVFWMRNDGITPGTYREYFQLVADGIGWMSDYGFYWDIVI